MGIPVTHRKPHVTGQRPAYAAKSAETGGPPENTLPRPAPHLRDDGPAERRGRQDRQQYARPLLGGLHAGHLRPRHNGRPTQSRPDDGQYPLPCCLMLSAICSRWGQRLGQKKAASENGNL